PDMPCTTGETDLPVDRVDVIVDATSDLCTLDRPEPDEVDRAIVERVLRLIPEGAWVQLGIGAVPDAVLAPLADLPDVQLHSGVLTDALPGPLAAAGWASRSVTGEVEGSAAMYSVSAADPRVTFLPTTRTHDVPEVGKLKRFVSINSALEVDLWGQVNGETI